MTFWATPENSDWDVLILGGATLPGIAVVDTNRNRTIEQAKRKKHDGVFLTDSGNNASPVRATLTLWTAEQYDTLKDVLPNIDPTKQGGTRSPLDISHPVTRLVGISQVYVRGVKVSNPSSGIFRVEIDMIEWFPDIKTVRTKAKPKGIDGYNKAGAPISEADISVPPSQNIGANT